MEDLLSLGIFLNRWLALIFIYVIMVLTYLLQMLATEKEVNKMTNSKDVFGKLFGKLGLILTKVACQIFPPGRSPIV